MTRTLFAAGILFLFLIGCAAKEPQTQQEMTEGASMTDKVEATTPTEAEKVEAVIDQTAGIENSEEIS